jgi:agmatine deiminase
MSYPKHEVTLGLIQARVTDNIPENVRRTTEWVRQAAAQGAQIVCLQELFDTIYFPQYEKGEKDRYAEPIPGETTDLFSKLAGELGIVLIVPIYEKAADGHYYNSAVTIDEDGSLLGVYRKVHIPFDPLFYEKNYFVEASPEQTVRSSTSSDRTAEESVYKVYKTRFATFGVLICYDQWFPEAARINALMGAEILFYPTAIGWIEGHESKDGDWHDAWETVQRGHAIANGIHVAAVNRVGEEDRMKFWGGSFVADAFGKVLKKAGPDREEVLVVKVDLSLNHRIRNGWGFFDNRRPDTYQSLLTLLKKPKP